MTRTVMLQGTGSDVGKTVLVAALCRLAANRGLRVRPFKPQNMSNNAAVADDGGEIGRAQWLQSLAARVPSSVHMNPVLLKPQTDTGSQIIVQGKVWGQAKGRDYQKLKPQLLGAVLESFATVRAGTDLVIVEGAGSPAEINLRPGDIANMGFATRANVPVVLVGDIDRGGVIASLVGTHAILDEGDRAMIQGYLINKFRGDVSLFDDGIKAIGGFTGWPCFGVVPWLKAAGRLPAEDSVVLERLTRGSAGALKVAVPVLPRIANFDDLDPLSAEPDVDLVFVRPGEALPSDAALIVLPGSKSTIGDLHDFKRQGWDRDLSAHVRRGGRVIGICGGYQMLGRKVCDPHGSEGLETETAGSLTPRRRDGDGAGKDRPQQPRPLHGVRRSARGLRNPSRDYPGSRLRQALRHHRRPGRRRDLARWPCHGHLPARAFRQRRFPREIASKFRRERRQYELPAKRGCRPRRHRGGTGRGPGQGMAEASAGVALPPATSNLS